MPNTAFQAHRTAAENALKKGDFPQLVQIFLACLAECPHDPLLHKDLGKAYLKLGDPHAAKKHFLQALHLDPHNAEIYYDVALFHRKMGNIDSSIRYFQKALRINPLMAIAHHQLANTYAQQNQFDMAATHYHEALQFGADANHIHRNLGMIYFNDGQWEKAAHHLNLSFHEAPDDLIGLPLGQALLNIGKPKDAEYVYTTILQLSPHCHDAHHNLAILRLNAQDKSAAKRHFQAAANLQPNNATAQHMSAALNADLTVHTTPLPYIKALFDQYAPYYDQHMRDLKYDVPLAIRNVLGEIIPTTAQNLSVLDLGCGTGRCGLYCRDLAHTLVGVDLSTNMLAAAKALGAYDTLVEDSLQHYLANTDQNFDIIVAAEVVSYVGDTSNLWPLIIKALKPRGCFVFTTEHTTKENMPPNKAYILEPTGRFSHKTFFVEQQIASYPTLFIEKTHDLVLRQSVDQPITGRLWCLTKCEKDTHTLRLNSSEQQA